MTNEVPSLYDSYFSSPWAEDWMNFPYNTYNKNERVKAINFIHNCYLESEARPYILVFKKNDPSFTPIEIVAEQPSDRIEAEFKILGRWFEGEVYSTTIGPALAWDKLLWDVKRFNNIEDLFRLDLIGIKNNGDEDLLFEDIPVFDFDLSVVKANIYPLLKLNFYAKDEVSRTSPQMDYWRIMFTEKPEAVLNVNERFVFKSDTIFLGNNINLETMATNITNTDMDSLLVKYTIIDDSNTEINQFERLAPLLAKQNLNIDFEYPTNDLLGLHEFRVEINPEMEQPEQYSFNNIGILNFEVQGDRINPLLDVTFDGVRIMDGDIISPAPLISVVLKDENEFLLLNDITVFDLAIQKLPDPQSNPIDLFQSSIVFYPADTTSNNLARLEYSADFETGDYVLYVQASDASGNISGDQTLEIRFKVVEDSQISNVLNYPNPFSTSTEFVFTLTGYEIPEVFNIQIMTLSGKIVREITKEELGNLRIGLNRTDYKWDGTDEYGNRLANGVYLYRVMTSDGVSSIDHFNNEDIDSYFKHGFGKLVIMR